MHVSGSATLKDTVTIGEVVKIPLSLYAEQDPAQIVKQTADVSLNGYPLARSSYLVSVVENPVYVEIRNLGIDPWPYGSVMNVQMDYVVTLEDYPPALSPDDWLEILRKGEAALVDLRRRIEALEGATPDDAPPVNDDRPVLTGVPEIGQTLTVVPGSWQGYPVPVITHQWTRDGSDISGQTALTYLVVSGDAGKAIACRETGTNSAGSAFTTTTSLLIQVGAPVITPNQEFTVTRPLTAGQVVGTVLASGSPTSWAFSQGNANGYWAISNAGVITITEAGAAGVTDGLLGPKITATNEYGASTPETVYIDVVT